MFPKLTYRWQVSASPEQRHALEQARDHHPKPYVRERCAAILLILDGKSPNWGAVHGVLKPHDPNTISRWVKWYQRDGLAGLLAHQQGGPQRRRL